MGVREKTQEPGLGARAAMLASTWSLVDETKHRYMKVTRLSHDKGNPVPENENTRFSWGNGVMLCATILTAGSTRMFSSIAQIPLM